MMLSVLLWCGCVTDGLGGGEASGYGGGCWYVVMIDSKLLGVLLTD